MAWMSYQMTLINYLFKFYRHFYIMVFIEKCLNFVELYQELYYHFIYFVDNKEYLVFIFFTFHNLSLFQIYLNLYYLKNQMLQFFGALDYLIYIIDL